MAEVGSVEKVVAWSMLGQATAKQRKNVKLWNNF